MMIPRSHSEGGRKKSLRTDLDAIAELLRESIQQHVDVAGIVIEEAKIAHLAYAPEIANAMLRRQQAEAVVVVMAREKLVDGAVGMVEGALKNLEDKQIVSLTSDQRAVLLSESGAQPVIQMAQATQLTVLVTKTKMAQRCYQDERGVEWVRNKREFIR